MTSRARRMILLTAAALCVGGLGLVFRIHLATAELEARRSAAREHAVRLAARLHVAKQTTVSAPPPSAVRVAPSSKPAGEAPKPAKAPPGLMDIAGDNPRVLNLWIASRRSLIQRQYGLLMQSLQLAPAQRERFKDIMAAEVARGTDIAVAAQAKGLARDDPLIKSLYADSRTQTESGLRDLLGQTGFRAYQEFERSLPVRGFVDGFAMQVASTEPLTLRQTEQLAAALIAANSSFQKGERADPATVDWAAVDAAAQQFLSPAQYAAWKLGTAHNEFGGSRLYRELDQELEKAYRAARASDPAPKATGG